MREMRALCVLLLTALIPSAVVRSQTPEAVVENGDFEGGFTDGVAEGWHTWADPWGEREYHDERENVHGGAHAQGWTTPEGSSAGIYQVVNGVTQGQAYRLTMWTWYDSRGDMWAECGFDPSGGTEQSEVHWTKMERKGGMRRWLKYEADLVTEGDAVSVWFKWGAISRLGSTGLGDDVSLVPIEIAKIDWCSAVGKVWLAVGPPLPGAEVSARPARRSTTSSTDGGFSFAQLYPDVYSFTARKGGYLPETVEGVEIKDGSQATVEITMVPVEYVAGGDFEGVFTEGIASYWTPWHEKNARYRAMKSAEARHGGGAAQYWETIAGRSGIRQIVVGLEEGAACDLSLWVLPDEGAAVACGYDLAGGKELANATWLAEPAPTDAGWLHYTARLTPEKDRLTIWLSWTEGGGVVDDVSLTRHDADLDAAP